MSRRRVSLWHLLNDWEMVIVGPGCVLAGVVMALVAGYEELPVAIALVLGGIGMILVWVYMMRRGAE